MNDNINFYFLPNVLFLCRVLGFDVQQSSLGEGKGEEGKGMQREKIKYFVCVWDRKQLHQNIPERLFLLYYWPSQSQMLLEIFQEMFELNVLLPD